MFNKQKILTKGIVIHCPKEEQAIALCSYLHSIGRKWSTVSYLEHPKWKYYKENTCYHPCRNEFSGLKYFQERSQYTVIPFEEALLTKIFTHKTKTISQSKR